MPQCVRIGGADVLDERSPGSDGECLEPATDSEQREPPVQRSSTERELEPGARRVHPVQTGGDGRAVVSGVDVEGAARDHHRSAGTEHPVDQRGRVPVVRRKEDRLETDGAEGVDHGSLQVYLGPRRSGAVWRCAREGPEGALVDRHGNDAGHARMVRHVG